MIIVQQIVGTGLTDFVIDEATYAEQVGAGFSSNQFKYDGADWNIVTPGQSGVVLLSDYGISFTGTPVTDDEISIAQFYMEELWQFRAGDGINCIKLNENFAEIQTQSNSNENRINNIETNALKKDGSNLTDTIVADFQKQTPNIISGSGDISLTDNSSNFLTLTANNSNKIVLPLISSDQYSHTINLTVEGSNYSLDITTATSGHHLYNDLTIDPTQTYNVLFIYNKIDGYWYYSITQ